MVAEAVNGLPPYEPFPGWVAVVQPGTEPGGDRVGLQVLLSAGDPPVSYTVYVCGRHAYSGFLLIGGEAQLTDPTPIPAPPAAGQLSMPSAAPPPIIDPVPVDLELYPLVAGANPGPVQRVHITIRNVPPCGRSASPFDSYAFQGVQGHAAAPFEQRWTGPFGWLQGPHISETWPLTGAVAGVSGSMEVWTGLPGAHGQPGPLRCLPVPDAAACPTGTAKWTTPTEESLQIGRSDAVPTARSIDTAYPVFPPLGTLTWSSATAIEPMARLTDSSRMATLQQFLVGAGIVMAIGLSPLGNQIYEWWKRRFREPGTR